MKVVEKNTGRKIDYELRGYKLSFADDELVIRLDRYQRDEDVTLDIMADNQGFLVMSKGRFYVAQVEIPKREYEEIIEGEGEEQEIHYVPIPLNTDDVTLYLFSIEGILIN